MMLMEIPSLSFLSMPLLSLIIAIVPFVYVSYPILKAGYNSITHKILNMDVMYSMGILVAFISSVMGTFNIILNNSFMFYETAIMLASFLLLGRYLEAKAKKRTSVAIKELIGLQPKTANILVDKNGNKIKLSDDSVDTIGSPDSNDSQNSTNSTNSTSSIDFDNFNNILADSVEKEVLIEDIELDDLFIVKPGEKIPTDSIVIGGNSYVDESMITGEPIPKFKDSDDSNNMAYGGTLNQDGTLYLKAIKIGKDTVLSQVIELTEKAQSLKPNAVNLADKVVEYFIPTIILIAIISFLFWYFVGGYWFNIGDNRLLFSITTLISVLVVACPCALGLATPTAVTVGIGRMSNYGILVKNGDALENAGRLNVAIFDKTGTITEGKPSINDIYPENNLDEILKYAGSIERNSNHPIAKAIVEKAESIGVDLSHPEDFTNISGKGLKAVIDGKNVLSGNKSLMDDEKIAISDDFLEKYEEFSNQGKTTIYLAVENEVVGVLTLSDKIKENSKKTINALKSMNIETLMITGDNEKTAKSVASEIGIDNVIAEVLPNEKLENLQAIQKEGKNVLFVGDGINDAPAISGANLGIALGSGTDIAMESGDIVIIEGDLENVVAAIQFSKKLLRRIKENIFWAFAYNVILIPIACGLFYPLFGLVFRPELAGLAMAISSLTVISLSLMLRSYIPPIKKISV
jgi:Cu+-exporting ATPase